MTGKSVSRIFDAPMELLAPAGSLAAFEAALAEGADAVYAGAPGFNARALASDFSLAEIGAMIDLAHRSGRKFYLAMNSLIKEEELPRAVEALSLFARLKPDALIIQDLGLWYIARRFFPDLTLHSSTLMSAHNSLAVNRFIAMGFERVVLARELTIDEIRIISEKSKAAELEVFVHGAMCFSYSGLCMFSSLHGGRSSLRGKCVQPCRRRYVWRQQTRTGSPGRASRAASGRNAGKEGGYLFSMNDLCGIDLLPALRAVGVVSLKVEGRLKSVEYVRKTVRAYRLALDTMDSPEPDRMQALEDAHDLLDEAMGRKRAAGYFLSNCPAGAVTPSFSGTSGLPVGRVERMKAWRAKDGGGTRTLSVRLLAPVAVGDRLRLHAEPTGERQSFTLRIMQAGGKNLDHAASGQKVRIIVPGGLEKVQGVSGGLLFRVDVSSRGGRERPSKTLRASVNKMKRIPDRVQVERILDQLGLRFVRKQKSRRTNKGYSEKGRRKQAQDHRQTDWWIRVNSLKSLDRRFPVRPNRFVVPLNGDNMSVFSKASKFRHRIVWSLPPIIHEDRLEWYGRAVMKLRRAGVEDFQLGHCAQAGLFAFERKRSGVPACRMYGDYTLNILNSAALRAAQDLGLTGIQCSLETDSRNMAAALGVFSASRPRRGSNSSRMKIGMLAYGRPPLFTARLKGAHFHYGRTFVSPMNERFVLDYEDELTHARSVLPFSLLRHIQEAREMGVHYFVLDLSAGPLNKELISLSSLLRGSGRHRLVFSGNFQGNLL